MKKLIIITLLLGLFMNVNAQDSQTIKLNSPSKKGGITIMEAFSNRQSDREYSTKKLSDQVLADLLWAANGINRPDIGKRTAPTASNKQEIDIYVCLSDGAYLYDAKTHSLVLVYKGDLRADVAGGQDFAKDAPVSIVIVGDTEKFGAKNARAEGLVNMDGGIVSQNISLFCAGNDLGTVARATMNVDALKKALKLSSSQMLVLNHPVGYKK